MKLQNNNNLVINKLISATLKKNKLRNIFCIIAIILTTFMISSVFTISLNFYNNFKTMQVRTAGSVASVFLSNPTESQITSIKNLGICDSVGQKINAGSVILDDNKKVSSKDKVSLIYYDNECFENQIKPCLSDISGNYPESEDEIMLSKNSLSMLSNDDLKASDYISLNLNINGKSIKKDFRISGTFTNFPLFIGDGTAFVSKSFALDNNLSLENNGVLLLHADSDHNSSLVEDIKGSNVILNDNQSIEYGPSLDTNDSESIISIISMVSLMLIFIMLSAYFLIYNIIYLSVVKDINFYGLLKTIGTSPKQLKRIVNGQANRLAYIGIPVGLILAALASFLILPLIFNVVASGASTSNGSSAMPSTISFNPLIFVIAVIFSYLTVRISCHKSAKIVSRISPIEAMKYSGVKERAKKGIKKSRKSSKIYKMAFHNIFRDKKRAIIVFISLFMGIVTFIGINTFLTCASVDNYIKGNIRNDFEVGLQNQNGILQNSEKEKSIISDEVINELKEIDGLKDFKVCKSMMFKITEYDSFIDYIHCFEQKHGDASQYEQYISGAKQNNGIEEAIVSISDDFVDKINDNGNEIIDKEKFNNGDIAIISIPKYMKEYYNDIKEYLDGKEITLNGIKNNKSKNDYANYDGEPYTIKLKTYLNNSNIMPKADRQTIIPSIYISNNSYISENFKPYLIASNIGNLDKEKDISSQFKEICQSNNLSLLSKSEMVQGYISVRIVIGILGGSLCAIFIFIGLINFINVMVTGINARTKEFAVLESIGMTKKQQRNMVITEGFYYGLIINILIYTLGSLVTSLFVFLCKKIIPFSEFSYPYMIMAVLSTCIFVICMIVPEIVLKISTKKAVTERLRNE